MSESTISALAAFDAAVAAELPRVSHGEYDSHEICEHFAGKVRERMAAAGAAPADDWHKNAADAAIAVLSRFSGFSGWFGPLNDTLSERVMNELAGAIREQALAVGDPAPSPKPADMQAAFFSASGLAQPEQWKIVAIDGQPAARGLYVAIYRRRRTLPVSLCSYGFYERGCWHEESDSAFMSSASRRDVAAYFPTDFSIDSAGIEAIRTVLAAQAEGVPS